MDTRGCYDMTFLSLYYLDATLAGVNAGLALWLGMMLALAAFPDLRRRTGLALLVIGGALLQALLARYFDALAGMVMWLVVAVAAAAYRLTDANDAGLRMARHYWQAIGLLLVARQASRVPETLPEDAPCPA
jgi:hypothetical protein